MKYRLLYNKITVVALSAMLSLSAVSCGKLDASKLDGNALTVTETESKAEVKKTEDSSSKKEVEVNEEEKRQATPARWFAWATTLYTTTFIMRR